MKNYFKQNKKLFLICLLTVAIGFLASSCSKRTDETPPSAPLLTITDVNEDQVTLAWSESYDDRGVDEYRLYRDGDVVAKVSKTQYTDKDVKEGKQYEYYVVAYDEAGNKSNKSVKQRVTVKAADQEANNDPGSSKGKLDMTKLSKSTIKVFTLDNDYINIATGSGTIMNKEGYILTNFHVVGEDGKLYNKDGIVAIALTDNVRETSAPKYYAQYRSGVPELDLAVVQIVADINGNEINPADLKLSPIKITDSDDLNIGDDVNILGYPGVGGDTITYTAGRVAGFMDEDGDEVTDWIKTDALVNHGNSGGTAVNDKGEMIGVPSAKLVGEDADIIFFVKPINQALSVLEDAIEQGSDPDLPESVPDELDPDEEVSGTEIFGRIVDSFSNEPIEAAAFIILKSGVTVDDFIAEQLDSQILAYGETDSDGYFSLPDVPVDDTYSVIVVADGYMPFFQDNVLELSSDVDEMYDIGDVVLEPEQ